MRGERGREGEREEGEGGGERGREGGRKKRGRERGRGSDTNTREDAPPTTPVTVVYSSSKNDRCLTPFLSPGPILASLESNLLLPSGLEYGLHVM